MKVRTRMHTPINLYPPLLLEQKEGVEEELPNTHLNISSIQDCMQVAIRYALLSIAYVQARKFIGHTPGLGLDHTLSLFNAQHKVGLGSLDAWAISTESVSVDLLLRVDRIKSIGTSFDDCYYFHFHSFLSEFISLLSF